MDKLVVNGPCKLSGEVKVSKAKNASLPILAAIILFKDKCSFTQLPGLSDIKFFFQILESLGVKIIDEKTLDAAAIDNVNADYELVRKMRASVLVLGPLLGRFKKAQVSLPGGCAIGSRPVDIHLKGMEALGAEIKIENGYIHAKCDELIGCDMRLEFPSVGATENIMMAAVYAKGITTINNCAMEPEIDDLANFLVHHGVQVEGIGTPSLKIHGASEILNANVQPYEIIGDRIEAATYIIAALMTKSQITVSGFNPVHLTDVLNILKSMGAKFEIGKNSVTVLVSTQLSASKIKTRPYPGFPTDVQAQMMALMGMCDGESKISELIFENRFMHVPELQRMGYIIAVDGKTAIIKKSKITCAPVMCTDLRASAALLLAGLVAHGETHVARVYHIDRGYDNIEKKLKSLGADIKRVSA